jgi:hypothetical protein
MRPAGLMLLISDVKNQRTLESWNATWDAQVTACIRDHSEMIQRAVNCCLKATKFCFGNRGEGFEQSWDVFHEMPHCERVQTVIDTQRLTGRQILYWHTLLGITSKNHVRCIAFGCEHPVCVRAWVHTHIYICSSYFGRCEKECFICISIHLTLTLNSLSPKLDH